MIDLNGDGLHPTLQAGVTEFTSWVSQKLKMGDEVNKITIPLYHYTDAAGLIGIIKNKEFWFTSIFHLNDPSEHRYGIELAVKELGCISKTSDDGIIKHLCERVHNQFLIRDMSKVFGFFVASFSREPDDLGQWRAYGDNGHGFALGLAPHLFQTEDEPKAKPNEKVFVAPVIYCEAEARKRQREAIEAAATVALKTLRLPVCQTLVSTDNEQGNTFIGDICDQLVVLILSNSLTTKHKAYKNESEVRLIIIGGLEYSDLPIETRSRRSQLVPFIRSPMPLLYSKGAIRNIRIGPAADFMAEGGISNLLWPLGIDPTGLVSLSPIPYRPT